jgi:chromosome segregation ATPase
VFVIKNINLSCQFKIFIYLCCMENVRKHLEDSHNRADEQYWNLYTRLEQKKKELQQLQSDVLWMEKDMEKYDTERKYFMKLLEELNNNGNGNIFGN